MIRNARFLSAVFAFTLFGLAAHAQVTETEKQLSRIDLGISGAGIFTRTVTGTAPSTNTSNVGQTISVSPSSTLGVLVNLRYIKSPYFGVELNYSYARFTENYSRQPFGVQTQANEETAGYVVTPKHTFFGLQPFASGGVGLIAFKPTPRGGEGLPKQAVAAYYYSAGVQEEYFSHLGFRASFRQVFYQAPDYFQNYLTIEKHTFTSEPTIGFYLRF